MRGVGPAKARKEFAEAAKLLGNHSTGLPQVDPYLGAVRIWSRLIDDPKAVNAAAEQFDVILRLVDRRLDGDAAQRHRGDLHRLWPRQTPSRQSNDRPRSRADHEGPFH
jgi:hypothetical protein